MVNQWTASWGSSSLPAGSPAPCQLVGGLRNPWVQWHKSLKSWHSLVVRPGQTLLSNMVYEDDDEALQDAEVSEQSDAGHQRGLLCGSLALVLLAFLADESWAGCLSPLPCQLACARLQVLAAMWHSSLVHLRLHQPPDVANGAAWSLASRYPCRMTAMPQTQIRCVHPAAAHCSPGF